MRRIFLVLPWILLTILGVAFFSTRSLTPKSPQTPTPTSTLQQIPTQKEGETSIVLVTRVVDGDTVEIEGGERVRYIGIDTPERGDCFGQEATEANKRIVERKQVQLEKDIQEKDKYGRTLAYVWIENVMVNEKLVEIGYALVSTYPPNIRYQERFVKAQGEARDQNRGLWASNVCSNTPTPPSLTTPNQVQGAQTGCVIKGNISSSGEKIYHLPSQRYYEKTQIEENKGERWFCSEEEARDAGWRKSKV